MKGRIKRQTLNNLVEVLYVIYIIKNFHFDVIFKTLLLLLNL